MFFKQDWLMRQIEMLVEFVAAIVFHKQTITYEIKDESNLSEADLRYKNLKALTAEGKICEAENMLFDKLDTNDTEYLKLALDFYQNINKMSDEELEAHNFSREEINEGANEIMKKFNLPPMI